MSGSPTIECGYWLQTDPDKAPDPNYSGPEQEGATWIAVPRLPLEHARIKPPAWVTRPDGKRLWIIERLVEK